METSSFIVRIAPRAETLSFKHPLIARVIRKASDPRDPTKGWVTVSAEQAEILRPIRVGGTSDPTAHALFDIMTQADGLIFQQREMAKLGLGTPEHPVGGSPIQNQKIAALEGELAGMKTQNEQILALLRSIASKTDPGLAEALRTATPDSINLELAPGVGPLPSVIDPPQQDEPVTAATAGAPPAPAGKSAPTAAAPPKNRPGAPGASAKPKAQGDGGGPPESLSAKLRAEGRANGRPSGDLSDDADGEGGAHSA